MSEELKAAQARIACLEGEIAKRDETIARLEPQLNRSIQANYDLRAELAEINAQGVRFCNKCGYHGPMETHNRPGDGVVCDYMSRAYAAPVVNRKLTTECNRCLGTARVDIGTVCDNWVDCPECAAPVSEPKAQGVVQWPEADEIMQMAFEEGQPADDASGYCFELEEFDLFIERLMSEVARLNAAPVQQVSVQGGLELIKRMQVCLSLDDTEWGLSAPEKYKLLGDIKSYVLAAPAAPAAPAADAGYVFYGMDGDHP